MRRATLSFPPRPGRFLRRFGRDEDGSMVIFAMFMMLAVAMITGMSVDLMRYESSRARLQATLDRAVLAAADLDQAGDCESVVDDYVEKAGLLDNLTSRSCDETINSRTVTATAEIGMDTYFMDLVGVPTLEAPAASAAIESVNDIEIVLVLDVSGSMSESSGGTTKIANLRMAAREFVQTILENDQERRISIAVVPFNAQVNLGPTLFNAMVADGYAIQNRHGTANSFCIDMPPQGFSQPGLPLSLAMPQTGHFDGTSTTTRSHTSYTAPQGPVWNGTTPFCRAEPQNFVRLPGQSIATLQNQIQALTANGNTSITLGMKWGLFMLDPGTRPLFSDLVAANQIPATLAGRPYDWDRDDTLKVIVVMTDGEHVSSRHLENGYRTETSPIYRASDGRYSIYHASRLSTGEPYWVPHLGDWHWRAWSGSSPPSIPNACNPSHRDYREASCVRIPAGMQPLPWNTVWAQLRVSWVAWSLYARALGTSNTSRNALYDSWMATFTADTSVSGMNSTLQQSCAQARANGVVVFGIAFEAPANGQTQIFNCASSPAHYYDAQGLQIRSAFRAIASQINTLRLIQ